jgi:phosphopantetheine adenylyltransferase
LIADPGYNYYSSTIVREILKGGKDVSRFLPAPVMEILNKK